MLVESRCVFGVVVVFLLTSGVYAAFGLMRSSEPLATGMVATGGRMVHVLTARVTGQCSEGVVEAEVYYWPGHVRKGPLRFVDSRGYSGGVCDFLTPGALVRFELLDMREGVIGAIYRGRDGSCPEFLTEASARGYSGIRKGICGSLPATAVRIIDGDTVEILVRPLPGHVIRWNMRIRDIDTPETRRGRGGARCEEEIHRGSEATDFLEGVLDGEDIFLKFVAMDGLGRVLASVYLRDGRDIGRLLLDQGLAVPYVKGDERDHWCRVEQARSAVGAYGGSP